MLVIFTRITGILSEPVTESNPDPPIIPAAVGRLNILLEAADGSGPGVVLMDQERPVGEMQSYLNEAGFDGIVKACLPPLQRETRAEQIQRWLDWQPTQTFRNLLILDQGAPFMGHFRTFFVSVDGNEGLLDRHVARAFNQLVARPRYR